MDKSRENVMEMGVGEHVFDPFLSLDNDLDDVSEVIRNNLFGEHPNLFDSSRTPSPQYYRDTSVFMSSNNMDTELIFPKHQFSVAPSIQNLPVNSYDKEIGEIVSLLQDENPLLSSPGPSSANHQSFDSGFGNLQIKQDYSMMDTSGNEAYELPQQNESNRIQFASTSTNPMDYHQMVPQESPNIQITPYNLYDNNQLSQQQYPPTQYMYEMPRASSSSAIHGMLGSNELQQVVVDENTLIRPLSDQNLSMYSSYPPAQQVPQSIHQFGQNPPNDGNTKQELIKMLLEMTPGDFEKLRSQKLQQKQKKGQQTLQANSPTPVDPIRKRSSLQLSASPQPLMVSIGSSPSLESNGRQTTFSPDLISPQSSSTSGAMIEWREESDNESTINFNYQQTARKGPKTERRTAHNLIEKKYRCSINDRINHLKEMLAPEESKLSKSATLRKAIDHILHLRQQNVDLIRENDLLKKSIKALGGEVPLFVNTKYSRHHQPKTVIPIPDDSSESAGSAQSSNSSSPKTVTKKSGQMLNRSRVSLSIFMFTVLMINPFSLLFGSSVSGNDIQNPNIIGRIPIQHRTLKSFENDFPFDEAENSQLEWWHRTFTKHAIIWLVNLFIVFIILTRLLVYGEPVMDRRSPTWMTFVKAKKNANDAISACNYKEAQRQLSDTLYILGRALPRPGIDEFMSFAWQVIRHVLNGLWIGRWFSRRRRSKSMPAPAVCRSHASTALVYHQLNQLHLLGIDAIESGPLTGLNLALSAVNLAESAGISRDGISHRQRADIYIHAALTTKLNLPRFLSRLVSVYFLQRARRHVRKSSTVDGIEMRQYEWVFHPLSQNFFSDIDVLHEILINGRQMAHFPFSHSYISPKPIDRLTGAFKMHLLALLMDQLNSSTTTLRLVDFVDISHLLLSICMSDSPQTTTLLEDSRKLKDETTLGDWECSTKGQADELCMWWTHLITCGLFWKFGDYSRAQKHYSLIRKCPKPLLTSYLALGVGMALCTRKICMEDQNKKEFVNMVWFHVKESFVYIKKEGPLNPRKTSNMSIAMNQLIRSLTYEWLLNSMLDVWRLNLDSKAKYWEHPAPSPMRQLYREVLADYSHCGLQSTDKLKILTFKMMSRLLDGANPLTTWRILSKQCTDLMKDNLNGGQISQMEIIKRLREDIKLTSNSEISEK